MPRVSSIARASFARGTTSGRSPTVSIRRSTASSATTSSRSNVPARHEPWRSHALRASLYDRAARAASAVGRSSSRCANSASTPIDDDVASRRRSSTHCPNECATRNASSRRPAACTRRRSSARAASALAVREDVGRHNAVDKLVGWGCSTRRYRLRGAFLWSADARATRSCRRALMARIPIVASVSAPSSLAVDLARGVQRDARRFRARQSRESLCGRATYRGRGALVRQEGREDIRFRSRQGSGPPVLVTQPAIDQQRE